MKTFEKFLPDVLPMVPGCPEPVAELAIKRAAQRFCELTRAWRVTLDAVTLSAGEDTYDLPLPDRSELVRIESARLADRDIAVATPNGERSRFESYLSCDDGRTLVMNPLPAAALDLRLIVTAKPSNEALGVEDFIYGRYAPIIAMGAIGLLKQHPAKTYTDPAGGAGQWAEFESRCSTVRNALWRGNARNTPRTVPSWF
jgi:hypothetical protein